MTEQDALDLIEPIIRQTVNCIAEKRYEGISGCAEFADGITYNMLKEWAEDHLAVNGLSHYDRFGVPNNFRPKNPRVIYHQMRVYLYNDGSGFAAEYDLTTDGEKNDLTLMMKCLYKDNTLKPYIEGFDVL